MDRAKRYHITVIDRLNNSIEIDRDVNSLAGVLQDKEGSISRFANVSATDAELAHLIFALIREASHLADTFLRG